MDSERKINISGSILGVDFDVALTGGKDDRMSIVGQAGGKHVDITLSLRNEYLTAGGTLLGHPFQISSGETD